MMPIKCYLEDLENRIDPEVEDDLRQQWRSFASGEWKGDIFSPRRRRASQAAIEWPAVFVNDAIEDPGLMAFQQLSLCSRELAKGSGALLAIRANYGTSIIPSVFGAEMFFMDRELNTLPTSKPLAGGVAEIRRLVAAGVPDIRRALGGKTLEMGQRFVELLRPFPRVRKYVSLYHPDLQGPMDSCEVLWGSSLFLDVMDDPALVHAFLALITQTYARLLHAWLRIVPPDPDYNVHWMMLHRGAIMLRDDSAMNLSPAMFETFIEPYDQLLLDEFGGGCIHFCGRGDHYIHRLPKMRGVYGVNLSQPEYNDMNIIFSHTVDQGIRLLGLNRDAAESAVRRGRLLRGLVHCW